MTIELLDYLNKMERNRIFSGLLAPPAEGLLLAESPVFFLSFGPVLRRLQGLTGGAHGTVPLGQCLLGNLRGAAEASEELPWSDLVMDSLEECIDSGGCTPCARVSPGERSFDESQLHALKTIFTSTLACVQGPPGTGKSFTGVEAIRHLLKVPSSLLPEATRCLCSLALNIFEQSCPCRWSAGGCSLRPAMPTSFSDDSDHWDSDSSIGTPRCGFADS